MRDGAIQGLRRRRERRVEPLETREQLRGSRQPGGVERLLELARQPAELVGVGESRRLRLERLHLAELRRRAGDLIHDVPPVVALAAHLLALRHPRPLATLQLPAALLAVA